MTEIDRQKIINIKKFLQAYNTKYGINYRYSPESDKEASGKKYDYLFKDRNSRILVQHTFSTERKDRNNTYLGDWHILNERLIPTLVSELNKKRLQYAISLDMKTFTLNKVDIKKYCKELILLLLENKEDIPDDGHFEMPLSQYVSKYTNHVDIRKTEGPSFLSCKGVNMSGVQNAHLDLLQLFQNVMVRKESKSRRNIILLIDFGFDGALCKSEIARASKELNKLAEKSNFKEIWLVGDFVNTACQIK
jgi:hypothetical protein